MEKTGVFDVVIIGGSYAGLAAALALGRALRKVMVIDAGVPCNRQTPHSHNYLTQDGRKPAEIADAARADVLKYPTIEFVQDFAVALEGSDGDFTVVTENGLRLGARKVLFASGIQDVMPDITGFDACWGISAIHCPYCHGYEYRGQATGVLINGDLAFEFARMIRHWTDRLTVFTNGVPAISEAHIALLEQLNIRIVSEKVSELLHKDGYMTGLVLEGGERFAMDALYAKLPFVQHSGILKAIGAEFSDQGHVLVNDFQKTSLPGIFAAGDNSIPMRSVAAAVAAGTKSGAFMNHELIAEGF